MRFYTALLLLSCSEYTLSSRNNINDDVDEESEICIYESAITPNDSAVDTFEGPIDESIDTSPEDSYITADTPSETETDIEIDTSEQSHDESWTDTDTEHSEHTDSETSDTDSLDRDDSIVCTGTIGYWKNNTETWDSIEYIQLGNVIYSREIILQILHMPTKGDASIQLAKQLFAAKISIALGADDRSISEIIIKADAWLADNDIYLIGVPLEISADNIANSLISELDLFNSGEMTIEHC